MDNLTKTDRSKCMSRIRRKDTRTEIVFRKAIWSRGIRGYRVDVNLPGRPDLYFPKIHLAVFIDGCFWHKCPVCYVEPKSNKEYWLPKIEKNVERAKSIEQKLENLGVKVIRFWGHEVKKDINEVVEKFLEVYYNGSK